MDRSQSVPPHHKRKNWFVGIDVLEPVDETGFNVKEVRWDTMRASGPGGQHVNRTESAVRVTHLPTGVRATAMEERSQHRNRKLALARLKKKLKRSTRSGTATPKKSAGAPIKNWSAGIRLGYFARR